MFLSVDEATGHFWVEAREGGADGASIRQEYDCEPDALRYIGRLTTNGPVDQWRELPAE